MISGLAQLLAFLLNRASRDFSLILFSLPAASPHDRVL